MNAIILATAAALAALQPPQPYPPGYTIWDHAAQFGFDPATYSYTTQAGYTAARLRWEPTGQSLSTGVEIGFVKDSP